MSTESALARKASENLTNLRARKPLIHNITNYVVMNYTANALLACGASPVMAHAPEEVEEIVGLSNALVLNLGTLSADWVTAMARAGKEANRRGVPVVLDPVGSGASRFRTDSARRLIDEVQIQVIRGNASEVLSLAGTPARADARTARGVDSVHAVDEAANAACRLATELGTTLAITGAVDLVTDGQRVTRVANGHELMARVTGTGCTASALIGAFLAVGPDPMEAAVGALAFFGLAGEVAARTASTPGSYQVALLDALFTVDARQLSAGARIEPNRRGEPTGGAIPCSA